MNNNTDKIKKPVISVVTKVVLSVVIVISIVATVVSFLVYSSIQEYNTINKVNELKRVTQYQEEILGNEFKMVENKLRSISGDGDIINFLENNDTDGNFYNNAKNILNSYNVGSAYDSIYVMDAKGLTVVATNPMFEGNNYGFRDYFTRVSSDKVYSTTALGISTNNMGYYFSYPIYSEDEKGKLLGVVVIKIGEKNINEIFLERSGWNIALLDSNGVFIFSTDQSLILKSLVEVPKLTEVVGQKESQYLGKEITSLDRDRLWKEIKLSNNTISQKITDFSHNDSDSYIIAKRVAYFDYFILMSIKEQDAAFTSDFAINTSWKVLIAASIAMVIIIFTTSWILIPIKKINEFVMLLADGNYNNVLDIKTSDEFETLAESINNLQTRIKVDYLRISRSVDQNQKVSEKKVRDLEKLNNLMVNRELELVKLKNKISKLEKGSNNDK